MDAVDYLVIGAGASGLSFANWLRAEAELRARPMPEILIVERDSEPGGYCKTVRQDGFVWDYSGHFFHFKHSDIEAWLRARMPEQEVRSVEKRSFVHYGGRLIDFPFQKNIHQLDQAEFIDCLVDLYFRDRQAPPNGQRDGQGADTDGPLSPSGPWSASSSFGAMLYARFGRSIAEKFLVPYNRKLYACDLATLDPDAMGRFFPHADIADIIANMRRPDNQSYNARFTYPVGGAIQYIHALLRDLPTNAVALGETVESIDLREQVAHTSRRSIRFRRLVSSAPFPRLLQMCGLPHDDAVFSWNRVLVFNLGFDQKGNTAPHWIYVPDPSLCFYRVGYYDNIIGGDRMSLYIEIGIPAKGKGASDGAGAGGGDDSITGAGGDEHTINAMRERVLGDLKRAGMVDRQRLISSHSVMLDPAYVHITRASRAAFKELSAVLRAAGVYPVGRYGGWTYCSIEDNLVETRDLARTFGPLL